MKILITGASGFIGQYLSEYSVKLGHEVVGTYWRDTEEPASVPGIEWVPIEMASGLDVHATIESVRPEAVFHLAAQAYAKKAWEDPVRTFEINVLGTIYLYEALRRFPPACGVLLAASASAYGIAKRLPIDEDTLLRPTNPYASSKAAQDMLSYQYAANYGLRIIRTRLFGISGPGKTGDALNDFASQLAAAERFNRPAQIGVGNLDTRRDISDVRDAVRAMWLVFEKGDPAQPVNVGAGRSESIRNVLAWLVSRAKVETSIVTNEQLIRPTDEVDNVADVSRLAALGFEPQYPLERTVTDALDFWREQYAE